MQKPRLVKPDALTPDNIDRLIAFHRATFGGWKMEDGAGDGNDGDDGDSGGGDPGVGSGDTKTTDSGDGDGGNGFPANTPVADMTLEQQVAYHKHQSRKHEQRATAYRDAVGGKTADEVKAEAERQRQESLTEQQRAVEEAKREAREETAKEFGPKAVRSAFELALRALPEEDRNSLIDDLNLSKFLTDSGDVNTAKVLERAEKIAPADKDKGTRRLDFGGGDRGNTRETSGVAAGRAAYEASKKPITTN